METEPGDRTGNNRKKGDWTIDALNIILNILHSPAGSFAIVIAFIWLIFWAYGKILKIIHDHETLAKNVADQKAELSSIAANIVYIKAVLATLTDKAASDLLKSHSPISLTEKGWDVAREMDAEGIVARNWESKILPGLRANITSRNPYDIQQYCLERIPVTPEVAFDAASVDSVKTLAFNKGRTAFSCFQLIGIIIRDRYLKHLGIPLEEIDRHGPGKQPE